MERRAAVLAVSVVGSLASELVPRHPAPALLRLGFQWLALWHLNWYPQKTAKIIGVFEGILFGNFEIKPGSKKVLFFANPG